MPTHPKPKSVRERTGPTPWRAVFHRSRISPFIFVVARAHVDRVQRLLNETSLPSWSSLTMFGNPYTVTPLLDGLVHRLRTYGLPPMPSGLRLIGHRPLRLLCGMLELAPPTRRLAGEVAIPTRAELFAELAAQRAMPRDRLAAQAKLGIDVADANCMRRLVEQLLGPVGVRAGR